ncbi:GGDEF domain-containing protein [soil metagenome]
MNLDVPTLMLAGAFVSCCSGALLLFAWYQYRETKAALWWAGADALLAAAIVLMAVGSTNGHHLLFFIGLTLLCVSAALSWGGARCFEGHKVDPILLAAGPALWLAVHALPAGIVSPVLSTLLNAGVTSSYYACAAFSIRNGKGESLRSRLPLTVLLSLHAATLLIAVPASLTMRLLPNTPPPVMSWFGIIHFETLIFVIGTALFLVAIMKERVERRLVDATNTDALTGLLNRRGFLHKAERILERCGRDGVPAAVIIFELARFKAINDKFGHAIGDRALQAYGTVCFQTLRPNDVIGRIGGEEFAAILPGLGVEAGYAMAERIRKAYAEAVAVIDGSPVGGTLCGGVTEGVDDIHDLLRQADAGLYRAKAQGRNRIECVRPRSEDATNIVRIA